MVNPGKGHLLGRDIVFQPLKPGSIIVGERPDSFGEFKELCVGGEDQVLTVENGDLVWKDVPIPTEATGTNLTTGSSTRGRVFASAVNSVLSFRVLEEGPGVFITENANTITLELDPNFIAQSGGQSTLGTPSDGSLIDPRFVGAQGPATTAWTPSTPVVDAVDDLNEILGLLIPTAPDPLSARTLSLNSSATSRGGSSFLLSNNVTDNTGGLAPNPGDPIRRITSSPAVTSTANDFGPGNAGTLSALVNGLFSGQIVLAVGDQSGTDQSLQILDDSDFPPATPGFHESLDARISATVVPGVSSLQMSHTDSGDTNQLIFVYDDLAQDPITTGITVALQGSPTFDYNSGIPHLSNGAIILVDFTTDRLAGKTYLSSNVIQIQGTNGIGSQINLNPGDAGLPSVFSESMGPQTITGQTFTINNNVNNTGNIRVRGRNSHGDESFKTASTNINVLSSSTIGMQDLNVTVTAGLVPPGADSQAKRILLPDGDNPSTAGVGSLLTSPWDPTDLLPGFEAAIRGGVLRHDTTNYTSGFIPPGPNYSAHNADQYVTYFFRRSAVSRFNINITGSYTGLWVATINPAQSFPDATNGWLDMFALYTGAGVPGANGSNGCAEGAVATGSSGVFTCTFGTLSTTASSNNIVIIRFKLTAGESITALSFDSTI